MEYDHGIRTHQTVKPIHEELEQTEQDSVSAMNYATRRLPQTSGCEFG